MQWFRVKQHRPEKSGKLLQKSGKVGILPNPANQQSKWPVS